ncbi:MULTISPECIES: ribbon-helix-helix protein, CopG family [Bacillus cereus group]|uniref:ribbon-helix-helix protein, CopG family n=1 Tax=Bacillus cereus group TaxID=86661 RepID=UPI000BF5A742|nr:MULTISPECIES: ribbon-helix-helix protein, CopG family [Bacillus cereus group]KAA6457705.1 ribbon-helix-helix protein, CopG family [Bacillus cereus]KAB2397305.1 ribbon-helix-helix protein, CopG family [Bacillus cereus]KAB2412497.1 ribbon-helix-helix protein, CopG family [Bacillus cereus]KAB2435138.1 ribbon-helix-helix protein, CopG family [Bacillus cereus]KAB2461750.1 ribbon-helix-helix protein, CopG family [Bacillus cereus]
MNVLIRDLDASLVKRIDELAKAKKISRQEFLHRYISNLAVLQDMKDLQDKHIELQKQSMILIKQNTQTMNRVLRVIEEVELDNN